MFKSLLERMNIVNMVFKTDQWFGVLLLCSSTFKASGVQITTNVSTMVDRNVNAQSVADSMNYNIDVNRYSLDLNGITSLVFEINTCTWAHVLLSSSGVRNSSEPFYDIAFLGRWRHYIRNWD
ncbi:uncharacterized protein LOC134701647 [Mytilus trossulus]|uniref:uncharacterized protein LOC134701647 n=1 Tax=Mytilus trossulus TaxID=6551 RepID=UPI0030065CB3